MLAGMKLLNLGCGNRFRPGWVNADLNPCDPSVIACNALDGLPFESQSFDFVYMSHTLEHFTRAQGLKVLRECKRLLKAGGVLRVVVPDLEKIALEYLQKLEIGLANSDSAIAAADHDWTVLMLLDQSMRDRSGGQMLDFLRGNLINRDYVIQACGSEIKSLIDSPPAESNPSSERGILRSLRSKARKSLDRLCGITPEDRLALEIGRFRKGGETHLWMYDAFSLQRSMKEAGLGEITRRTAGESFLDGWSNHHLDTEEDGSAYKPESLYMEGRSPRQ